jgi:hypothetical protein
MPLSLILEIDVVWFSEARLIESKRPTNMTCDIFVALKFVKSYFCMFPELAILIFVKKIVENFLFLSLRF